MATRIVEGKKPYTGGKAIEIDENKVISLRLRDENNLIIWDEGDNEIYVDLQLPADIEPTDAFPVGITTGRVSTVDGWDKTGTIICAKTTNGDNIKLLYADDGTLYIDNGTGTFKQIYLKGDIDTIVQAIYQYIDANFNTKTFRIRNFDEEMDVLQDVYTWVLNGGEAIVIYANGTYGNIYISEWIDNLGTLTLKGSFNYRNAKGVSHSTIMCDDLLIYATNGIVTGINYYQRDLLSTLETTAQYTTPFIPTDPSQPTSKKYVDDKVAELMALGKFLSLWSCADGEPMSFPLTTPYTYTTGDYYLVGELATGSNPNLKPDGSSYDTGDVSQVTESAEVQIGDVYIYDGTVWMHQLNHERTTTFANIAGDPYDNTNLATALGDKQDELVNQTNIKSVNNNSLLGSGNLVLDVVPSGGTQGQVLTKQSTGYGWANATGGAEIEYKTQAEYNALPSSKLTDGKHYFIYSTSGGGGWQPGMNTVAYYPLNSTTTTSDMKGSGTAYNLNTLRNGVSYGTYNGVDCANFSGGGGKLQADINIQQIFTLSGWFYITQEGNFQSLMLVGGGSSSQKCLGSWYRKNTSGLALTTWGSPEVTGGEQISGWHHICITRANIDDSNDAILYLDGVHYLNMNTSELTLAGNYLTIGGHPWNLSQDPFYGCASEIIYEDVVWTSIEVLNYFNQTKANYGIS